MASNHRLYYALLQAQITGDGQSFNASKAIHGLQNSNINTNFKLTQVFEMGQLSLYVQVEEIPDINISMSKVLDGAPLIYHLATVQGTTPTLAGRGTAKCVVGLSIYSETNTSATGSDIGEVICSGEYVDTVAYRFPVDGNSTEEVTLVGNNKVWANDPSIALGAPGLTLTGAFTTGADVPISPGGQLTRRQSINFTPVVFTTDINGAITDPDVSVLPQQIPGINSSGINVVQADGTYPCHIQSISTNVNLNRTQIDELGHLAPYFRYPNFPCSVNTEIQVVTVSGDMVSAIENGIYSTGTGCGSYLGNLKNSTIRIATCDGTRVYLGLKNKLQSVSQQGGDTGGGNMTVSYNYLTFNDFTVLHSGDPNISGATGGPLEATWLTN